MDIASKSDNLQGGNVERSTDFSVLRGKFHHSSHGNKTLAASRKPITDLHVHDQLSRLKSLGYNVDKLNNYTQLKVFLYTWLAMERGKGG